MWFNLSSDAQQLTMRIVFVLCCSFIPAKFTNKCKCCLPVFDYDFLVQNAFRNRAWVTIYCTSSFYCRERIFTQNSFKYYESFVVICGVLHDYDLQVLTLAVPSKFRGNGLPSTAGVREFQVLQGKAYYWTIQTIHSHYRAKWMWWVDIWWGTIKASFQGLLVLFQSFKAYNSCSCMAFCISLSGSNHMTVVLWSFSIY